MSLQLTPIQHGEVESTNAVALATLEAGSARHGDLHLARAQSAGRGRRGRRWESPSEMGLYASVVLLPPEPVAPGALTGAGALAVLDTVRGCGLNTARLKWPNDVLVAGRKLAGVLAETRVTQTGTAGLVVGVGLNVKQIEFTPELENERPVTSLAREGVEIGLAEVATQLQRHLTRRLEQALRRDERLSSDFLEGLGLGHAQVHVEVPDGVVEGQLMELDLTGELVLLGATGRSRVRVEHVRGLRAG